MRARTQPSEPVRDARKRPVRATLIPDTDEDTLLSSCRSASAYLSGVAEHDNWPRMLECQELLDELRLRYEVMHSVINRDTEALFYEALAERREA